MSDLSITVNPAPVAVGVSVPPPSGPSIPTVVPGGTGGSSASYNQSLNTTDSPTFAGVLIPAGYVQVGEDSYDTIYHTFGAGSWVFKLAHGGVDQSDLIVFDLNGIRLGIYGDYKITLDPYTNTIRATNFIAQADNNNSGSMTADSFIATPQESAPSPVAGQIYFDGTHFQGWNGSEWKQLDN
jgi:hypothetical protein